MSDDIKEFQFGVDIIKTTTNYGVGIIKVRTNLDDLEEAKTKAFDLLYKKNLHTDLELGEDNFDPCNDSTDYKIICISNDNYWSDMARYNPDYTFDVIEPTYNDLHQLSFDLLKK